MREPWERQTGLADLPGIQVKGLPAPEARELLSAEIPGLDDRVGMRIAADLERAAGRATTRGGWAAGAAFLTRAAVLSPGPASQARRLLAAASAEITAGAPDRAQLLLDRSLSHLDNQLQHGPAKRAQGAIYHALDQPAQAAAVLLAAAADLAALDVRLARATLLDALAATAVAGPLALDGATSVEAAAAARAVPLAPGEVPGVGDLLLSAEVAVVLDGHRAAAPLARRAITALRRDPSESAEMLDWLEAGCRLAGVLGYDTMMRTLGTRLEQQARRQGALPALGTALIYSGTAEMFAGSLDEAQERFIERGAIESAREGECSLGTLLVMAWRGQEEATRSEAARVAQAARRLGEGWRLTWVEYAICVVEQPHVSAALRPATTSRRRKRRSRNWHPAARPTRKSLPSYLSAPAPSITTSAKCSASST